MKVAADALLAGLNTAQREAVLYGDGPLLVLAGAGSGKTRVLTSRITRLISEESVSPDRILAVTFTNKAAGEMRDRVARQLGDDPKGMWIGTFHAIGARMVRRAAHSCHRTPSFTIYDEDEQLAVVKRLMERHRIAPKQYAPRAIRGAISDAKNALVSVQRVRAAGARSVLAGGRASCTATSRRRCAPRMPWTSTTCSLLPVRLLESNPRSWSD